MKKLTSVLILSGMVSGVAMAADAPASPHTVTGNVSMTSDYLFRGITQTSGEAAIQGGFDYSHSSGFYAGTWGSNVSWLEDFQGYTNGSIELDLYAGKRGDLGGTGLTYDVGVIGYFYPGTKPAATVAGDTTELYAALGWKWFTAKYSYSISNETFGFGNSEGSTYLDVSASYPLGETGLTLGAHWGTFDFKNNPTVDYDDWKVSVVYDMSKSSSLFSGVTAGVAHSDTNAGTAWNQTASATVPGMNLGKSSTFFWISKAL